MAKFIKLTSKRGETLYMNPSNIESIMSNTEKGTTEIRVFMREPAYSVTDTVDEIVKKIEKNSNIINFNVDKKSQIQKDSQGTEGSNT
jgi:uncharacterized protein YlzI (FlbEa/FlbD family)